MILIVVFKTEIIYWPVVSKRLESSDLYSIGYLPCDNDLTPKQPSTDARSINKMAL